jgi:hypothetical protein
MIQTLVNACLAVMLSIVVVAAQGSPRTGAAERPGGDWPYPEPAQRGATGYSPDYSAFQAPAARWDIYANILWRRAGTTRGPDVEYYDYELSQFLQTLAPSQRARLQSSGFATTVARIRAKELTLPYRDPASGCLLFRVKHGTRMDLAANQCGQDD